MQNHAPKILRQIVPWLVETKNNPIGGRLNYKGCHGRIGIVGGARDYAGAPYFASMSAMRLGADLAYVICSQSAAQSIKNYSPDIIVMPVLDCPSDTEFHRELDCLLQRLHALVIGPGLGREPVLQARAKIIIDKAKSKSLPLILDADSLLLVNQDPQIIKLYPKALLTPNRIELQRLLESLFAPEQFDLRQSSVSEISAFVRRCSSDLKVSILAKGPSDIVSDEQSKFMLSTDSTSGSNRRCGGQGDILAGLAGLFSCWCKQANDRHPNSILNPMAWAGYLAAIITRLSNKKAYDELHSSALTSDMIDKLHIAFDELLSQSTSNDEQTLAVKKSSPFHYTQSMNNDEISRYARHMTLDEFGPQRQMNLKKSSALIIGAGGLGCPVAAYLGAAGIGCLGIVDNDTVEASNLHRQILHSTQKVGMLKSESLEQALNAINPNVKVQKHSVRLNRHNAVELIEKYDIILDCTDNLQSRYMISDACVIAKKPLVSGAALKMNGQLTVYNYEQTTPCFRCLFPSPPAPNAVGSCSEEGVLGVIPGIIGVQQSLEALKIASGLKPAYAGKMLLFDGQDGQFKTIALRSRNPSCEACGPNSKLTRELVDYEKFCGTCTPISKPADILDSNERISVEEFREILNSNEKHVLIDVRPAIQSSISRFEHAIQLPVSKLVQDPEDCSVIIEQQLTSSGADKIFVICRRGIASQRGVKAIKEIINSSRTLAHITVKDIIGGMTAWSAKIDNNYRCV